MVMMMMMMCKCIPFELLPLSIIHKSLSLSLSRLGLLSQYHHHNDENYIENYKDDDDDNDQDDDDDDDNGRPCAGEGMISTVSCEPIRVGTTFPVLFH